MSFIISSHGGGALLFAVQLANVLCVSVGTASHSRFDRDAYIRATGLHHGSDDILKDLYSWTVDPGTGKEVPKRERHPVVEVDDSIDCRLFLAESSIPNSGLGMYSGVKLQRHDTVGNPEVGIPLLAHQWHVPDVSKALIKNYPWSAFLLENAQFEAESVENIIPGFGMSANSHLGLYNTRIKDGWKSQHRGPLDRASDDPGVGAMSDYYGVVSVADKSIDAGGEIFANYGEGWFSARKSELGIIPSEDSFKVADQIISEFLLRVGNEALPVEAQRESWNAKLKEVSESNPQVRVALPSDVVDLSSAKDKGTALFSLPNAIRSLNWLHEHGQCMDNIKMGQSTIPQAGRGAFATRILKKGSLVAPASLVTIDRDHLRMFEETTSQNGGRIKGDAVSHQLLLNYCFGHTNSSLLFFPYSSSVHFINHSKKNPNARIQWSRSKFHHDEWLSESLDYIKASMKTGLMFDVVATKDISLGEEVLLDYGDDWDDKWNDHVRHWKPDDVGFVPASRLNSDTTSVIRTVAEQAVDPYPSSLDTVCYYQKPEDVSEEAGDFMTTWEFVLSENKHLLPCDILSRTRVDGRDWYTARVYGYPSQPQEFKIPSNQNHTVSYIPRWAIKFVEGRGKSDHHLLGAFRHSIGIPDGVLPPEWIDL